MSDTGSGTNFVQKMLFGISAKKTNASASF